MLCGAVLLLVACGGEAAPDATVGTVAPTTTSTTTTADPGIVPVEVSPCDLVNVDDGEGRFGAPAALFDGYMAEEGAEIIPDLGVAAVYVQGFRGLAVDAGGGRYIALGVNGGYGELAEPRDVLVELATAALGRL